MRHAISPARLAGAPLFHGLATADLNRLAALMWPATFYTGATLIAADSPGARAYLLCSGTVKIHVLQPDGRDVVLALLGPREIIGELSLVDGQPHCAGAVALEE